MTPENQQRILNMVRNKDNCHGIDDYGVVGYTQLEADGTQLWAEVNPNTQKIRNCGINNPGQTRTWNLQTGLKAAQSKG